MKSFKEYISEYLNPKEKSTVDQWKTQTPEARQATDYFFGKGREDRYEKLDSIQYRLPKSETHKAVENHLGTDISVADYNKGIIGNSARIASAITNDALKKSYKNDPSRVPYDKNQTVWVSRSPYGVAGQTSREQSWYDSNNCKNFNKGTNNTYLPHEVQHGTVVAYLLDHDGTELSRSTFQPYINNQGRYSYRSDSLYGKDTVAFKNYIKDLESRLSQPHKGSHVYTRHPLVYHNDTVNQIINPTTKISDITDSNKLKEISSVKNPEMNKAVLSHQNKDLITPDMLEDITRTPKDTASHHDILNRFQDKLTDTALANMSQNNTPDIHDRILTEMPDRVNPKMLRYMSSKNNAAINHRIVSEHPDKIDGHIAKNLRKVNDPEINNKLSDLGH